MSYQDSLEMLENYNQWVAVQKSKGVDITASAYLIDKAKDEALTRVNKALEKLDEFVEDVESLIDDDPNDEYAKGMALAEKTIRKILEDSDE